MLFFSSYNLFSQDVEFSQYFANPLYLNPAFAGSSTSARVALNYRTILPSSFGDYVTYSASYDQYIEKLHGGIGIQLINDRQGQGALNMYNINLLYSYQFKLTHDFSIYAGIKAGYSQNTINPSKMQFPDMFNPINGVVYPTAESLNIKSSGFFDFSTGVIGWYKNYYLGISSSHLAQPNEAVGNITALLYRKYTVFLGGKFPFYNSLGRSDLNISPNILYQQQSAFKKLNLGLYLNYNYLTLGLWLRQSIPIKINAAIFMFGYTDSNYSISYSYDIPVNKMGIKNIISGAHEVTFLLKFEYKNERKKRKAIKCPDF